MATKCNAPTDGQPVVRVDPDAKAYRLCSGQRPDAQHSNGVEEEPSRYSLMLQRRP